MNINTNSRSLFVASMSLALLSSCKKTETIGLPDLPQDRMLEYKVTNLPDTVIYGAIDHIENTVTVYLPYYYAISHIDPEIRVQPGAVLEDEILPVHVEETKQHYTVTGADGNSRTYDLKIAQQNPPSLSVDFDAPPDHPHLRSYPKRTASIIGYLFSTSPVTLKIKMVHQRTGRVFQLEGEELRQVEIKPGTKGYRFALPVPFDVDSGFYDIEVGFLGNTARIARPLKIEYRQPRASPGGKTVSPGSTLLLESDPNTVFLGLTKVTVTVKGTVYNLPIIGTPDRLKAEVKMPDDLPIGSHGNQPFHFTYEGWPDVVRQNMGFTVTAKK